MTTVADLTVDEAIRAVWRLCDKPERLRAFEIVDRVHKLTDEQFWSNFWDLWVSHESIYRDRDVIDRLLARDCSISRTYMEKEERDSFDNLPMFVEIYRGCRDHNRDGWSWTLDREVAGRFALRSSGKGRPLILHAIVAKQYILSLLFQRGEKEVVIDPARALVHHREKLPATPIAEAKRNTLYEQIHAGMFNFGDHDLIRAKMLVANAISHNSDLHGLRNMFAADVELALELGASRGEMNRDAVRLIDAHLRGDPVMNDFLVDKAA